MAHRPRAWVPGLPRRRLLAAATGAAAFAALRALLGGGIARAAAGPAPFGAPQPDPLRLLDLPPGFSYRVISRAGALMDDGLPVPAGHDGMGAFDGGGGRVVLVCNHELALEEARHGAFPAGRGHVPPAHFFDVGTALPCPGGTTTLVYDPATGAVERHFLSLAGTERNCAGGPTPWGTWLTCEETVERAGGGRARDHGWVFEVPAAAREPVTPEPLRALGRFNHEAVAVDPATGILYLTEDQPDSLLYRFLPAQPGRLPAGGRLQALVLPAWPSGDTRNRGHAAAMLPEGRPMPVRWIDLDHTDAPDDDLRRRGHAAGAALFARGEGICHGAGVIHVICTAGGAINAGQVFRYRPSPHEGAPGERTAPGTLELFVESRDRRTLENCDNVVMTPWGDLFICEDAGSRCSLVGVTPAGLLYHFAENPWSDSELAGACFAPDGRTLFVNLQQPGLTLAVSGPFPA
jgi:hypothetical protein